MITNAKVEAVGYDPAAYHKLNDGIERGDPKFVMGRSDLMDFAVCPSRWRNGYRTEDSDATDWGSLIDTMVLEPDKLEARYAVCPATYPDSKTGEPKPWTFQAGYCKKWREDQAPRLPIKIDAFKKAVVAVAAVLADERIRELLDCSQRQVFVRGTWVDKGTKLEIPLKCLIDLVPNADNGAYGQSLADFKTARNAGSRAWRRVCFDRGYDAQAALYLDLYNAATNAERIEWHHAISENVAPYQTARRLLSHEFLELGRLRYTAALSYYAKCVKENVWPDYDQPVPGRKVLEGWQLCEPEPWMLIADTMLMPDFEASAEPSVRKQVEDIYA